MEKIIKLSDYKPHISGFARCMYCSHEWAVVAPVGESTFECPECHTYKGIMKGFTAPEIAWECQCGSLLFFIAKDGFCCAVCGIIQEF